MSGYHKKNERRNHCGYAVFLSERVVIAENMMLLFTMLDKNGFHEIYLLLSGEISLRI